MSLEAALGLARQGRLYPGVILHGGDLERRRSAALALARILLCAAPAAERPCGACRHCRRLSAAAGELFHPDLLILEQDLRTATSVEAARELLRTAQVTPFEARGQVFVVARADTLSGEASDVLLKVLEEPPERAPRHFLLLAPSQHDLAPTLRSRCLALYLGPAARPDPERVGELARGFAACVRELEASGAAIHLLAAASVLARAGDFRDPRAEEPWLVAAAAVRQLAGEGGSAEGRGALLALAEELLAAPALRLRSIPAERILEALVAKHLSARPARA